VDKYASWASASYGATTNSMFSDFKVCNTITCRVYSRVYIT
jgi:hypothetical protein